MVPFTCCQVFSPDEIFKGTPNFTVFTLHGRDWMWVYEKQSVIYSGNDANDGFEKNRRCDRREGKKRGSGKVI
jgi:hypothetical protein